MIFLENFNLITLDMYNGLAQIYCIEPEAGKVQYKVFPAKRIGQIHSKRNKLSPDKILAFYCIKRLPIIKTNRKLITVKKIGSAVAQW